MINSSLQAFADKMIAKKRISFGDVKRLGRDILPDGILVREEADLLLALDRTIDRADQAWSAWLVTTIVDFVVWGARPTGHVDEETARWLATALTGEVRCKSASLIVREIAREAEAVDEALLALVTRRPKRRIEPADAAQASLAA